jgi:hypothetical protein
MFPDDRAAVDADADPQRRLAFAFPARAEAGGLSIISIAH